MKNLLQIVIIFQFNCELISTFNERDISALQYLVPKFLSVNNKSTLVHVYDDPMGSSVCGILAKYTFGLWHPQVIVNMNEELMNRTILKRDSPIDHLPTLFVNTYTFLEIWKQSVFVMLPKRTSYREMYEYADSIVYIQPDYDFIVALNNNCEDVLLEYPLSDMLLKVCVQSNDMTMYRSCHACNEGKKMTYKSCSSLTCTDIYNPRSYEETNFHGKYSRLITLDVPPGDNRNGLEKFWNGEYVRVDVAFIDQLGIIFNSTLELYELDDKGIDLVTPQYSNGTWTGITGEVLYGDAEYAMMIIPYLRTFRVLSTGPVYVHEGIIITAARPTKMLNKRLIIQPFSLHVWIVSAMSVIFIPIVLTGLYTVEKGIRQQKCKSMIALYKTNLTYLLRSLVCQMNADVESENAPSRSFLICWFLISLVLITGYTSKMTSLESVPPKSFIPNNVDELWDNDQWTLKVPYIYHVVTQSIKSFVQEANELGYKFDFEHDRASQILLDREVSSGSLDECLQEALEKETFCGAYSIHIYGAMQHFVDSYGALLHHVVTPIQMYSQMAIPGFKHGHPFLHPISRLITRFGIDGGTITWYTTTTYELDRKATYRKKRLDQNAFDDGIEYQNVPKPLKLISLFASRSVLTVGLIIAAFVLIFELMRFHCLC